MIYIRGALRWPGWDSGGLSIVGDHLFQLFTDERFQPSTGSKRFLNLGDDYLVNANDRVYLSFV